MAGEGCFSVSIFKDTTNTGFTVKLIFILAQHSRDMALLQSLVDYLGCGRYTPRVNQEAGDFMVTKFADFTEKIIPFFAKYPIAGVKSLDFADFCKVAELMQQKAHLTEEGLAEIRLIKAGMNLSRAKLLTSGVLIQPREARAFINQKKHVSVFSKRFVLFSLTSTRL